LKGGGNWEVFGMDWSLLLKWVLKI